MISQISLVVAVFVSLASAGVLRSDASQALDSPAGFWVSPSGSDSNPGTQSSPFLTPGHAQQAARTAIASGMTGNLTITLAAGQYHLNKTLALGPEDSGRDGFVVRWVGAHAGKQWCSRSGRETKSNGASSERAPEATTWAATCDQQDPSQASILSVGVPVESWDPPAAGSKAWTGRIAPGYPAFDAFPSDLTDANGTVRTRARTPDLGDFFVWENTVCPNVREPPCSQQARHGFIYAEGQVPSSFKQPSHTRMVMYHGWTDSSHAVRAVFPENRTVLFENPSDRPIGYWPNHDSEGGGRYFYEALEALDSPGEWYFDWDRQQPLYIPEEEGEDPNEKDFVLSRLTQAVVMEGASGIEIDGLSVRHASWRCEYAQQQVCDRQSTAWQHYAAINVGVGSRDVRVLNTEVAASGGPGVWASANVSGVTIAGCSIHDLGGGGVRVGFDNAFLTDYRYGLKGGSSGLTDGQKRLLSGNVSADSYCHVGSAGPAAEGLDGRGRPLPSMGAMTRMALEARMPAPPSGFVRHDSGSDRSNVDMTYLQAATDVSVQDNVIRRGGLSSASGTAVVAQWAMDSSFEHNELHHFAYAGFSIGWCWNFATPSGSGGNTIRGNYVHDLGTGTYRQLGDAMAAFYTLGVQTGTEFAGNIGHDVYASYTGGYGLSQDQGSSGLNFTNNVLARINAAPQTQHYGENQSYVNNMFLYGMLDASTYANTPALRSVCPVDQPSSFRFARNVVAFSNSTDNETFHGGYTLNHPDKGKGVMSHHFSFQDNCYWNFGRPNATAFKERPIWGGCSEHYCLGSKEAQHLTFEQWQGGYGTGGGSSPANCTGPHQDLGSVVADPKFSGDPANLQFGLASDSPCVETSGFRPINLSEVGVRGD